MGRLAILGMRLAVILMDRIRDSHGWKRVSQDWLFGYMA